MGRSRKPTNLKIVEGNPGKRGLNKQEPDPYYLCDLTAPDYLTKNAKVVWDELAPKLRDAKLLCEIDVPALHMACEAIASYRNAVKKCEERLDNKTISNGSSIGYWEMIKSMSFKQAMNALQQFGMSPAARTKIAIQPQGELFADAPNKKYVT